MLQSEPSHCLCGCNAVFVFSIEGTLAPKSGEILDYTCPHSNDPMSFSSRGHWSGSALQGGHQVVKVVRNR